MLLVMLAWPTVIGALAGAARAGMPIPIFAAMASPIRVVCAEPNNTFASGQQVTRTLRIFNATRSANPIDMEWSFRSGGKAYAEGAETFALMPGTSQEHVITFRAPPFPARTKGELVLTCLRGGVEVFRVVKPCVILGAGPK
jgi:hypothetical protein